MDIKGSGLEVRVSAAEQSDEWLLDAAQEIAEAAKTRGLELPQAAGAVALEGASPPDDVEIEVVPFTVESIFEQKAAAFVGYQTVSGILNEGRRKKDQFELAHAETLFEEFDAWFTSEKLEYIADAMESDPDLHFTLVATPNVTATADEVIKLADEFGKDQPYSTYVYKPIYKKYSPEELSGTNPANGNKVAFSLIPSKFTEELYGTVEQQRTKLADLQAKHPDLKVPSVLDALTYWNTLRAQDDSLRDATAFDKTHIRHFDLPTTRGDDWDCVPDSFVGGDGKPGLFSSDFQNDGLARVAVG